MFNRIIAITLLLSFSSLFSNKHEEVESLQKYFCCEQLLSEYLAVSKAYKELLIKYPQACNIDILRGCILSALIVSKSSIPEIAGEGGDILKYLGVDPSKFTDVSNPPSKGLIQSVVDATSH